MLPHPLDCGRNFGTRSMRSRVQDPARRSRRTTRLTRTLARVGWWLVPWTGALMMSGTIAHGLEVGLARTTQQPPSTVEQAAVTSGAGCDARGRGARGADLDPW